MIKLIVLLISLICSIVTTILLDIAGALNIILFIILFTLGYLLVQVILFFLSLTLIVIFSNKKEVKHYNHKYRTIFVLYTRLLLSLFGIKLKVTGEELIPSDTTFVLVHNHLSNLDPIILNVYLRNKPLVFMAKKSLSKIPWFGLILRKSGFLFLERDGSSKDAYVIARGIKYLRNEECSVGIAPEGTRNFTDELLLPFKDGSFIMAIKAKKPIVVSVITKVQQVNKGLLFKKHVVNVDFLGVLKYEDFKDLTHEELSSKVYNMMYQHLVENGK